MRYKNYAYDIEPQPKPNNYLEKLGILPFDTDFSQTIKFLRQLLNVKQIKCLHIESGGLEKRKARMSCFCARLGVLGLVSLINND